MNLREEAKQALNGWLKATGRARVPVSGPHYVMLLDHIEAALVKAVGAQQGKEQGTAPDLGLSLDMLDADRLRAWADDIDAMIQRVNNTGTAVTVMRRMAANIETAVRDIGVLRQQSERAQHDEMASAIEKRAAREHQLRELVKKWRNGPDMLSHDDYYDGQCWQARKCANDLEALLANHGH